MIDFYAAGDGTLRADNKVLKLKGANWFGTEGQHGLPYGLEERGVDEYLGFLEQEGFNALRLLFSHEYVALDPLTLEHDPRDDKLSFDRQKTPALVGSSYLGVLELITSRAALTATLTASSCSSRAIGCASSTLATACTPSGPTAGLAFGTTRSGVRPRFSTTGHRRHPPWAPPWAPVTLEL